MEEKDDNYYIEKVIAGQTSYFSYVVEKYQDVVFSIALKVLKNREDAEEMAQESFVKAFKSLHTFQRKAKFSTWLYRITYNTCISETRKKKQYFASTDEVQISDEVEEMNFDGIPAENREKYIKAALAKLQEDEYTLVLLYYFEDQSVEDISKVTGLSGSNVKVKLYRARKKLYVILNEMLKEDVYSIL
ncbi:RNA polymerase sigma-70 factor, ECF subfamily [Mariniphaga anaerophila]|uniref:RNA polymerase sigma-70 factor, ECF subfamily n=1 Tax=Mariniphaga anaerophila TaxID=1484053 RepID=A0A1M5A4N2_9BACT|nr:RNA polymerase sigma factor [Mariniphaga anaerophila]SHF25057.1 RNA polymerase sigma-70 factor, ECF subfamily [Mariniphaga anaerophila]